MGIGLFVTRAGFTRRLPVANRPTTRCPQGVRVISGRHALICLASDSVFEILRCSRR